MCSRSCTRVFSEPTYGLKVSFVYVYKTRLLLYKATTLQQPIHVYLLRYTDKVKILKAVTKALKEKAFFESQIYISDEVLKSVRNDRAKLRKDYLKEIKEKEDVEFTFIPWSVPAQILYKKVSTTKLSTFKLPNDK